RAALAHRAAVVGADRDALLRGLRAVAAGEPRAGVVAGRAGDGATALLFTGQGAQRAGMGRGLHAAFPVFAAACDEIAAEFDARLDVPLRDVVWAEPGTGPLDETLYTQTGLFTLEVALYRLFEHWGVRP